MAAQLPALQVVLPLLGAILCAMLSRGALAWLIALIVSLAMPFVAVGLLHQVLTQGVVSYALGGWAPPWGIEYRVDIINASLLVLISVIAAVVAPYARRSVAQEIPANRQAWFYAAYLLCLAGLLGIAITGDAFNAFVFLEISSLATYTLIAMGRDRRALIASYQYLIMGTIGATFYVIGVGLLYIMTGTLNMADVAQRLDEVENARSVLAALAFITVGISLKLALFPLHVWLPNAYAYAPSVVTAFLAATATKVAIYLLLRFFYLFGPAFVFRELPVSTILIMLSIAAILGASLVAVFQEDVKRMFAYSSVAQIGYITLGIGLATRTGLTGGIVHLFNHALMKGGLFLALGAVMYRVGSADITSFAGLGQRMPLTMFAFVLGGLSLIGVPLTVGFISKWYLVAAALEASNWLLAVVVLVGSLLALVYVWRVVEVAYLRPSPRGRLAQVEEAPLSLLVPTWLLIGACIYFGTDSELTAGLAGKAADFMLAGSR